MDQSTIRSMLSQARQHFRQGRPSDAERVCQNILDIDPRHAKAMSIIGLIRAASGHHADAIDWLNRSLTGNPNDITCRTNLAKVLAAAGRTDEALEAARKALAIEPYAPQAFRLKVKLLRDLGKGDVGHAEVFDFIYANNIWKSGSGPGSSKHATRDYRKFLQDFLRTNDIRTVVDVGCGDWQFSQHIDWTGIDYLGVDVSKIVASSLSRFCSENIRFAALDAVNERLPAADLLLVKDVLQHWSNNSILQFLTKLPEFRYALITNGFPPANSLMTNQNIFEGEWRPVELRAAPFNVPGVYIFSFQADQPKRVFLWTRHSSEPCPLI